MPFPIRRQASTPKTVEPQRNRPTQQTANNTPTEAIQKAAQQIGFPIRRKAGESNISNEQRAKMIQEQLAKDNKPKAVVDSGVMEETLIDVDRLHLFPGQQNNNNGMPIRRKAGETIESFDIRKGDPTRGNIKEVKTENTIIKNKDGVLEQQISENEPVNVDLEKVDINVINDGMNDIDSTFTIDGFSEENEFETENKSNIEFYDEAAKLNDDSVEDLMNKWFNMQEDDRFIKNDEGNIIDTENGAIQVDVLNVPENQLKMELDFTGMIEETNESNSNILYVDEPVSIEDELASLGLTMENIELNDFPEIIEETVNEEVEKSDKNMESAYYKMPKIKSLKAQKYSFIRDMSIDELAKRNLSKEEIKAIPYIQLKQILGVRRKVVKANYSNEDFLNLWRPFMVKNGMAKKDIETALFNSNKFIDLF